MLGPHKVCKKGEPFKTHIISLTILLQTCMSSQITEQANIPLTNVFHHEVTISSNSPSLAITLALIFLWPSDFSVSIIHMSVKHHQVTVDLWQPLGFSRQEPCSGGLPLPSSA
uniref:Uncharacterized protein n=1 Tax=Sphaerodactylus townsendi TaxID=933632 RepID=A0ACB8FMX3_9SAUR